jgi:hypothetical protein
MADTLLPPGRSMLATEVQQFRIHCLRIFQISLVSYGCVLCVEKIVISDLPSTVSPVEHLEQLEENDELLWLDVGLKRQNNQ